jgi:CRISPR/Cas system Type II protein with McrA/HNH and RuvC-like nuclease domain
MTKRELSKAKNPDLVASLAAMRRAARMAREQAIRTDTAIVVIRNGKLVRVTADELRKEGVR